MATIDLAIINIPDLLWATAMVASILAVSYGLYSIQVSIVVKRSVHRMACCSTFAFVVGIFVFVTAVVEIAPPLMGRDPHENTLASFGHLPAASPERKRFNASFVPQSEWLDFGTYPLCSLNYAGIEAAPGQLLSILDLAVMTDAVYLSSKDDMLEAVKCLTNTTNFGEDIEVHVEDPAKVGRLGVFILPRIKTTVVVVRGSHTSGDWLLNFKLWAPAVFYKIVRALMPFGSLIPQDFANALLSFDRNMLFGVEPVWASSLEAVRRVAQQSRASGYRMVITGHSLGGGLGQFYAAKLGERAVVFSPVGMSLTEGRVGIRTRGDLPVENTVAAIVPWGDLVPMMDDQTGVVQYIQCNTWDPIACHVMKRTACEIYRKCGDAWGRDFDTWCSSNMEEKWKDIPMPGFFWNSVT
jgi:hypothetical protein